MDMSLRALLSYLSTVSTNSVIFLNAMKPAIRQF